MKSESEKLTQKKWIEKNREKLNKYKRDRKRKKPWTSKLLDKKYRENKLKDPEKKNFMNL